ncbi:MAG: hypothetical protein ACM31C_07405 [Acidobacteriota bacterium]
MTNEAQLAALQRKIRNIQGVWSLFMLAAIVLMILNWGHPPRTWPMRIAYAGAFGGMGILWLVRRSFVVKYQKLGGERPPKTN